MDIVEEILRDHGDGKPAAECLREWLAENDVDCKSRLLRRILESPRMREANTEDIVARIKREIKSIKSKNYAKPVRDRFVDDLFRMTVPDMLEQCMLDEPDIEWFRQQADC